MKYRKLRIAWSVAWGLATVLLIVLWVRSNWWYETCHAPMGNSIFGGASVRGFIILESDASPVLPIGYYTCPAMSVTLDLPQRFVWIYFTSTPTGFGFVVSMWFALAMSLGAATVPWIRYRFSLRTLLIATTLVAVVMGLAVWAAK
jgi:hypothetical protein